MWGGYVLNLRKIESKFYLSGGWQNIEKDVEYLADNGFKAVIDVQFTPDDEVDTNDILEMLADEGIAYQSIWMYDSDYNQDLDGILNTSAEYLTEADEYFINKKDKILVKCGAGVSRSAAILINYLCQSRRLTFDEALNYVRNQEQKNFDYMLGVSLEPSFACRLRQKYPETESAFGEKE